MNPTYGAFMKAYQTTMYNLLMGIKHTPKPKVSENTGSAFAKGHGVQQDEPGLVKEANIRAHLSRLAHEAQARSDDYYTKGGKVESDFPRSDLIELLEEHIADQEQTDRETKVKRDRLAIKAKAYYDKVYDPKPMGEMIDKTTGYPRSDLIILLEEEQVTLQLRAKLDKVQADLSAAEAKRNQQE